MKSPTLDRWLLSPRALALWVTACPLPVWAAPPGRGMHLSVWLLLLPVFLGLGLALHALSARAAKSVVSAARPLATGEPEIAGYDRRVYHTPDRQMLIVIGLAGAGGLALWLGALYASGWGWTLGLLGVVAALGLDLWWWQRVAVSGESVWFQRGLSHRVHQIAIENIRDLTVEEEDADTPSLRRGRQARTARLVLRLRVRHVAALPKTDADGGLDEVEQVANQIRMRQVHIEGRGELGRAEATATRNVQASREVLTPEEAEMRHRLRELRKKALAPDLPPAARPADE